MIGQIITNIGKVITQYGHLYLDGTKMTLIMSAVAVLGGTVLGTLVAMMKMSKVQIGKVRPLSLLATLYIEIIRGTPLLVQLYFFYFLIPMVFPGVQTGLMSSMIIALVLNSAGYMSEIIRSGIEAVDHGQSEAARSLGISGKMTMIRIILPQAVKNILPAMCNEFIMIIKETAILANFFMGEIMTAFKTVQGLTYWAIEPLVVAGLNYFIITFTLSKLVAIFERRLKASD